MGASAAWWWQLIAPVACCGRHASPAALGRPPPGARLAASPPPPPSSGPRAEGPGVPQAAPPAPSGVLARAHSSPATLMFWEADEAPPPPAAAALAAHLDEAERQRLAASLAHLSSPAARRVLADLAGLLADAPAPAAAILSLAQLLASGARGIGLQVMAWEVRGALAGGPLAGGPGAPAAVLLARGLATWRPVPPPWEVALVVHALAGRRLADWPAMLSAAALAPPDLRRDEAVAELARWAPGDVACWLRVHRRLLPPAAPAAGRREVAAYLWGIGGADRAWLDQVGRAWDLGPLAPADDLPRLESLLAGGAWARTAWCRRQAARPPAARATWTACLAG